MFQEILPTMKIRSELSMLESVIWKLNSEPLELLKLSPNNLQAVETFKSTKLKLEL